MILSAAVHRSYRLNGNAIFRPSILSPSSRALTHDKGTETVKRNVTNQPNRIEHRAFLFLSFRSTWQTSFAGVVANVFRFGLTWQTVRLCRSYTVRPPLLQEPEGSIT